MRRGIIESDHPLSRLANALAFFVLYTPKGETKIKFALVRRIDEQFLETSFLGVRQMTWRLRNGGHMVNEKRVRRLMRLMGLMLIYREPQTSTPTKG